MRKTRNLRESFYYALQGIGHCLRHERNIRIHLVVAALALFMAWLLRLGTEEFAVILLTIALVIGFEMMNTAMENAMDLVSPNYHPLAKIVKDVMAGAVFFACFVAVVVGIVIFLPHLRNIFF